MNPQSMRQFALVRGALLSYQTGRLCWVGLSISMVKFVGVCVVLFVLAVGFVVLTQVQEIAALFEAFRSEPLAQKLAWFVVVLVPLALFPRRVAVRTRWSGSASGQMRSSCGSAACARA